MKKLEERTAIRKKLMKKVFLIFPVALIVIGLMLFFPAGSFEYWQAWLYMGVLFIPCIFVVAYFLKRDPEFLERRLQYKEKEAQQKKIIKFSTLLFIIGFLMPGLDYRFGWSNIPPIVSILANIIVFIGYLLVFLAFKENSYAARTVVVEKGQKVITTGPYAIVRHPMYVGVIIMYSFTPIALGSYYALLFFIPIIPAIIFRTLNEEKVLLKDLKMYKEYCEKTRYRLIPRIW